MKKLLLLSTTILSTYIILGQSLASSGSIWNYSMRSNSNPIVYVSQIQSYDTLYNGRNAIGFSILNPSTPFPCPGSVEGPFLSERNDSVFLYEANKWQLLVDYNAAPGDTHTILLDTWDANHINVAYEQVHLQVDSIQQLTLNNRLLKSVYIKRINIPFWPSYTFHDGWFTQIIGHEYDMVPIVNRGCAFSSYYTYDLRCLSDSLLGFQQFTTFACNAVVTGVSNHLTKSLKDIKLYPNPSNGQVNIETSHDIESIRVFDANGRLLVRLSGVEITSNRTLFQLPQDRGLYLVRIMTEDGAVFTEKVIRE